MVRTEVCLFATEDLEEQVASLIRWDLPTSTVEVQRGMQVCRLEVIASQPSEFKLMALPKSFQLMLWAECGRICFFWCSGVLLTMKHWPESGSAGFSAA